MVLVKKSYSNKMNHCHTYKTFDLSTASRLLKITANHTISVYSLNHKPTRSETKLKHELLLVILHGNARGRKKTINKEPSNRRAGKNVNEKSAELAADNGSQLI